MIRFLFPRTKRCTLYPVPFSSASQKGFSALSLFFMGLVLLILMNFTGFFKHPKSPITDTNIYTSSGSKQIDGKGLHMTNLDFESPTPTPTTPITPVPTRPGVTITPTPTGKYCPHYSIPIDCECDPHLSVGLYCNGNFPPDGIPVCLGETPQCLSRASEDSSCNWYCMGKPVIYLYPTKPTYVDVTVSGNIIESIPLVEKGRLHSATSSQGWFGVLAMPGGILLYKNNYYRELYYESSQQELNPPNHGIFIKTENIEEELRIQTMKLGLDTMESNEFVEYWTPRLKALNKKYILFSILDKKEKERTDHVEINPKPDTFIEFIAYFKGVDEEFETKLFNPPTPPKRIGFTAVEWGGIIDR